MNNKYKNHDTVTEYARSILDGKKIACKELKQACERFFANLDNREYAFNPSDAEFVIGIIEMTLVHIKGAMPDGTPLKDKPLILEPWQKFIIYNLLGFYYAGTKIRLYTEAFIFVPRKNGKTSFIAALAWALSLLERLSGASVYIIGAALEQAMQSFNFIRYNIKHIGEDDNFRILDNNQEHSVSGAIGNGSIYIKALASNPDAQDSLNCNIAIADEIHAYKKPKQYNVIKEAMKAYTNKLMIGITTAGDDMTSFCYQRLQYCKKILGGTVADERYFVFICKADEDDSGEVDYTNPAVHEMANPSYGVTIRPADIMNDALQAQNDPQQRKDFFAKSLNVYTSVMRAYFNIDEFRNSDKKYTWTLERLSRLPIEWFGGCDCSKLHDLSAAAIVGEYKDVLIAVTHAWFPIVAARAKAEQDNIPLFGWKDDGWLTMTNTPTTNTAEIVNWFVKMKKTGFKIKQVGFDRKFGQEFYLGMKRSGFNIVDEPQLYMSKSQGFREIERRAKNGELYYMHSQAFEYCVENVRGIEKVDDAIQYEKVMPNHRIDIFDCAVFGTVRLIRSKEKSQTAGKWLNGG